MAHFEIWYAVEKDGQYFGFTKNLVEVVADGFLSKVVELAVSVAKRIDPMPFPYLGIVKEGTIISVFHHKVAEHLYDDADTKLSFLVVKPITRCRKCQTMLIDEVFHWSYKNQPTTPEAVLAKVCIPTAGHGDKQNVPCLAKQLHESDLGLLQKTPSELNDFVRANNDAIEFELPDEDIIEMARELLGDRPDEQS